MKWMLSCKQASQIISQSLDSPLSGSDRMKLRFHLFLCGACTRFSRQLRLLSSAVIRIKHNIENDSSVQLPLESKARIFQKISSAIESKKH
ncbi:zf-HC2 domain-containing protein [Methylotenera sp.]|uniref:zf-HC2 domain-containing protein n=2 Tax=Methylotenera sp. TaxID=2051956 RepID=UPI00271857F5|nr:zf-HC2 domain-containing protein [Methylotenera sp.]MDO9206359.1 zf-HC2 domain-containing protein [Methylotenera sp.]MDO9392855.1 zf-HC2 domain-containing protein [Methylotenera sp.]MDP1521772.1 zf-HC2 domain-containing protein [Methylotenera sp.]MDP2070768.1 zf-HC2 domain-containing protein [Methylotenera sp.]MDP2231370.1 zf-HC2 domain-containing protein [Methylotenera sp.]